MINKTRIVGNNFGEETFKIQNKWRKYKTTQSEDFVKEILCFPFFGSLIQENRAPPVVVFEKSSLQYGPETHGAGGGDVAIVREGELVRDALLPPGHRLQSGNIQQRRHNKQENQGACHAGRYCDLAVCEDFGIYFNNQETKEDRIDYNTIKAETWGGGPM